jgi:hypothetical protein
MMAAATTSAAKRSQIRRSRMGKTDT